jgi:hypothetical protein
LFTIGIVMLLGIIAMVAQVSAAYAPTSVILSRGIPDSASRAADWETSGMTAIVGHPPTAEDVAMDRSTYATLMRQREESQIAQLTTFGIGVAIVLFWIASAWTWFGRKQAIHSNEPPDHSP